MIKSDVDKRLNTIFSKIAQVKTPAKYVYYISKLQKVYPSLLFYLERIEITQYFYV